MIPPSVTAAISFTDQLLLKNNYKGYFPEIVMFSDESSDNDIPEGISWDSWRETISRRYGSHAIDGFSIPSDAAAMPYQKAVCYGYYPSYEVNSMQLIECRVCGAVLKEVGYGHHLRVRHARAKSPFSTDDCQTFLLSPPHIASPRHSDVSAPSPSLLKTSASHPTTVCDDSEKTFECIVSPQYSIEKRDELKLALRVSRREVCQVSEQSVDYANKTSTVLPSTIDGMDEEVKFGMGKCKRKIANGRIKSKKKKKRRSVSSSSDDFSLDHFRSKGRLNDEKLRELQSSSSTSNKLSGDFRGVSTTGPFAVSVEDRTSQRVSNEMKQAAEKICDEDRSSESPEVPLADFLPPSKKPIFKTFTSDSVRTRLRSFANASLKRPHNNAEPDGNYLASEELWKGKSDSSLSSEHSLQLANSFDKAYEALSKPSASCVSISDNAEEEVPPVLKPESCIGRTGGSVEKQEALVVKKCGSNTFVVLSKSGEHNDIAKEENGSKPGNDPCLRTVGKSCDVARGTLSEFKSEFFDDSEEFCKNENCFSTFAPSHSQPIGYSSNTPKTLAADTNLADSFGPTQSPSQSQNEEASKRLAGLHYDAILHGNFDNPNNVTESCSLRDCALFDDPKPSNFNGNQVVPSTQASYFSEEELGVPNGSEEICSGLDVHSKSGLDRINSSFGCLSALREPAPSGFIAQRGVKKDTVVIQKQFVEAQVRNQTAQNLRPPSRRSSHRVYRHPAYFTLELPDTPEKRMIFPQRKHEEVRYANARVAIAKVIGTKLDHSEFQKISLPYVASEEFQYDSHSLLTDDCPASTSEYQSDANVFPETELICSEPRYIPLSANSPFSFKVGDCSTNVGISSCVNDFAKNYCGTRASSSGIQTSDGMTIASQLRENCFAMPRNSQSRGNSKSAEESDMFQVIPSSSSHQSSVFISTDSSVNSLPPSLSPQQSPYHGLQSRQLGSDIEASQQTMSEIEFPSYANGWDAVNCSSSAGHIIRQTVSRKNYEAPPVLKRMPTTTVEVPQRRESVLTKEASGLTRRYLRQQTDSRTIVDATSFSDILFAEDAQLPLSGSGGELRGSASVFPASSVYRVVNNTVSVVRPTILANCSKRYRLLPSAKSSSVDGATVHADSFTSAHRSPQNAASYLNVPSNLKGCHESILNGTIAQGLRLGQRPVAMVPVLNRYSSSSPRLNGLTSLYSSSPLTLQSPNSATCISAGLPKTRMC